MKCEECPWFEYDGEGSESGHCSFNDWLNEHPYDDFPCDEEDYDE